MITLDPNKTVRQFYEEVFEKYLTSEYNEKPIHGGGGRTYRTPKDMALKSIEYFEARHSTGLPPTLQTYQVFMKFFSKEAFYRYRADVKQYQPDFSEIVNIVVAVCEAEISDGLFDKNRVNGVKFLLSCNYQGWVPVEKTIVENHEIQVTIGSTKGSTETE